MPEIDPKICWPGWETVRLIGRGSFGAVYEIERSMFGKTEKAALKVISIPQDQGDVEELYSSGYDDTSITAYYESYLADIVREYQLMTEMKGHTNVVNCDDIRYVQKDSGVGWDIFIKMELLTPMMKALDRFSDQREVARLGRDLSAALVLCRNRNIIHRDIKPQNIFLSKDGDYKLGDFGIAKTVEKTSGGTKIGTYNYMAPEVYNNRPYGQEADIYSLGMVLYWLLNERRLPFYPAPPAVPRASDMDKARTRRFRGEAIPAPAHGSEELKAIVLKCCAFDPAERYRGAEELLRALEAVINSEWRQEQSAVSAGTGTQSSSAAENEDDEDDEDDEEATVSVFGTAAAKQHLISRDEEERDPEEEKTVGVLWRSQPGPEKTSRSPGEASAAQDASSAAKRAEPSVWECECGYRGTKPYCPVCFRASPEMKKKEAAVHYPARPARPATGKASSAPAGKAAGSAPVWPQEQNGSWRCTCGAINPGTARFCRSCDAPMSRSKVMGAQGGAWRCRCGTMNEAGTRYCKDCDSPVAQAAVYRK